MRQIRVLNPIARSAHQPASDSKTQNTPAISRNAVNVHALALAEGKAHATSEMAPIASVTRPASQRARFPQASILQANADLIRFHI